MISIFSYCIYSFLSHFTIHIMHQTRVEFQQLNSIEYLTLTINFLFKIINRTNSLSLKKDFKFNN
ncbi:hypothetical protein ES707_20362 [subsurface metagenome]